MVLKIRSRSFVMLRLQIALALLVLAPATAFGQPATMGRWDPAFAWPNVAIHVHVLPNGKVLFWGRREWGANQPAEGLDPRNCTPRIWDPTTNTFSALPKPGFNLFCSGHTFLPDGRLLVVGGHIADGRGEPRATIFNPNTSTWTSIANMNAGRWYPTSVTLPNGRVLVSSGAVAPNDGNNTVLQILNGTAWSEAARHNDIPLYPRMHVAPDGRVFLSGHLLLTQLLNTGTGQWTVVGNSAGPQREDGCSVMYDVGKVLIVGGGLPAQNTAQVIDLNQPAPAWSTTGAMSFARRHHNATILPDGTVLVTGGTSGNGPPHPFNDLSKPVLQAELWNPATGNWRQLAAESVPRLYHSTAVLLPDARVLSAGGGEYRLPNNDPNNVNDSRRNAQIFSPPYLFSSTGALAVRPGITSAPANVTYGQSFDVGTPNSGQIGRVSWVRLSSVTHSFNQTQRINFLDFTRGTSKLTVTAPANANACPPGHYMLFVLNQNNVPSVAKIIRIG
jgi:galactose oxidase